MWETSCPATSRVTWWETEGVHSGLNGRARSRGESERSAELSEPVCIHRVRLESLSPETSYHYRVESAEPTGVTAQSAEHVFRTAPAEETPFSFAVTSETGGFGDEEIDRRVFGQIRRFRPDFLLMVGDSVQRGKRYEDCLGNHEENAPWFYDLVSYPEPKSYYSFDYGNAHVVALDCTALVAYQEGKPVRVQDFGPGCAQYEFLIRDLESCRSTWRIVFFHYPPYVSGDYEVAEMRAICPVLERFGVDLVFNSHTIVYERSHPLRQGRLDLQSGIVYVVAGGAGAMPGWLHPHRSWHTAQSLAVPHFVQVAVAGPTLDLRAFDDQGRLFDQAALRARR
jgi:hypothetical protein